MNRPNILLIMTDEHAPMYSGPLRTSARADALYGSIGRRGRNLCQRLLQLSALPAVADVVYDRPLHQPDRGL